MNAKLQHLLDTLAQERDEFRLGLHLLGMEAKEEWDKAEVQWEHLQARLSDFGYKLQIEAKEELHDIGEEIDALQHKVGDKLADVRAEVVEELHELGEELKSLYAKIRQHL